MDGERARARLGYVPRFNMATALRDLADWAARRRQHPAPLTGRIGKGQKTRPRRWRALGPPRP